MTGKTFGKDLIESLGEAVDRANGKDAGARVHHLRTLIRKGLDSGVSSASAEDIRQRVEGRLKATSSDEDGE